MALRWISGKKGKGEVALPAEPDSGPSNPANDAPSPGSDLDLVRRAKGGDREAFNQLVIRYQDSVFNLAFRLVGNRAQAEEAAQEAFLRAFQALDSFRETASFYTWLFRIAINAAYSKGRTIRRLEREHPMGGASDGDSDEHPYSGIDALPDPGVGPVPSNLQSERAETVQQAIKSLDPDFRNVVVLRDIEGKSYDEIAKILDCPEGTVRSRLHRARLELRNRLQHLMEQE